MRYRVLIGLLLIIGFLIFLGCLVPPFPFGDQVDSDFHHLRVIQTQRDQALLIGIDTLSDNYYNNTVSIGLYWKSIDNKGVYYYNEDLLTNSSYYHINKTTKEFWIRK